MPFDFNTPKRPQSGAAQEESPWTVPDSSAPPPPSRGKRGFQDPPQVKQADPYAPDRSSSPPYSPAPQPYRRPRVRRDAELPWRYILPVLGVILIVALLYIFRGEITAFLSTVLSWIIVLIIIVAILKSLLGIGRR